MKAQARRAAVRAAGLCDISLALVKARAARILLRAVADPRDDDFLDIPVPLKPGESEHDIREWIRIFAFDALDAALEEAEAAWQQGHGATKGRAA